MKFMVVLLSLLAVCWAKPGYYGGPAIAVGHAVPLADHIPAALNGLTPDGVPIDTPAVQHARAAHLTAASLAHSKAYAAPYGYAAPYAYAGAPGIVAPYAGVHGAYY